MVAGISLVPAMIGLGAATALVGLTLVGMTSSLPTVVSMLGGSQTDYATIITGSLLCSAIGVPAWGKLADLVNRKLLLQLALLVLVVGCVIAALAPTTPVLIAARSAQGFAIGGIISLTSIIVGTIVPLHRRGGYLGLLGAMMSVSIAIGPVLCGLVTDAFGWRWAFAGIAALAVISVVVLQFVVIVATVRVHSGRFDVPGLLLLALGLGGLLTAVGLLGEGATPSEPLVLGLLVGGALSLVALVIVELRTRSPIVPLRLLSSRTVGLAASINLTASVAVFGVAIFVTQYLQIALGLSVAEASLYLIPQVAGTVISSLGVGAIVSRRGRYKWWIFAGATLATSAVGALTLLRFEIAAPAVAAVLFALGLGMGAVQQNLVLAAQAAVGAERLSAATSLVGFFGSLGGVIGASTLASVLQVRLVALAGGFDDPVVLRLIRTVPKVSNLEGAVRDAVQQVYASGIADIFTITAPVLAVAAICAAVLPNRRLRGKGSSLGADSNA